MMKKFVTVAACAAAILSFASCSSFQSATSLNDVKLTNDPSMESIGNVNAKIWGIYVFNLPAVTGSSKESGKCTALTDTVTINDVVSLLTRQSKLGFKTDTLINLSTESTSCWIPPFCVYRSVEASANVVK